MLLHVLVLWVNGKKLLFKIGAKEHAELGREVQATRVTFKMLPSILSHTLRPRKLNPRFPKATTPFHYRDCAARVVFYPKTSKKNFASFCLLLLTRMLNRKCTHP